MLALERLVRAGPEVVQPGSGAPGLFFVAWIPPRLLDCRIVPIFHCLKFSQAGGIRQSCVAHFKIEDLNAKRYGREECIHSRELVAGEIRPAKSLLSF